jgi:uncharacterized protein
VRQQLLDLYEIQRIDLGIREIEKRFEAVPVRLRELEASIATSRAELTKLTEQRDINLKEAKTLESSVQAEGLKIKKWDIRLAEIRNQREYLALSREIEGGKRQNRDSEEKIVELTAQREQLDTQIEALQDKLGEAEVDCAAERERVQGVLSGAGAELGKEKTRRDALLSKVPAQLLRKYDAIRAKRFGLGLVPVEDGSCQGCNMKLPPQLYNILQRVETIEQCPSCQRLIFWGKILGDGGDDNKKAEGAGATP